MRTCYVIQIEYDIELRGFATVGMLECWNNACLCVARRQGFWENVKTTLVRNESCLVQWDHKRNPFWINHRSLVLRFRTWDRCGSRGGMGCPKFRFIGAAVPLALKRLNIDQFDIKFHRLSCQCMVGVQCNRLFCTSTTVTFATFPFGCFTCRRCPIVGCIVSGKSFF